MDNLTESRSIPFDVSRACIWATSTILLIVLNGPCLLVLVKTSSINEITKVFLMSMTVSDLGVAVFFTLPAIGVSCAGYWPYGDVFCVIQAIVVSRCYHAGTMSLLAVNMERYIAISWPLRYTQIVTLYRARVMLGIIWIINIASLIGVGLATGWHISFLPYHQLCDFASNDLGIQIFTYCSFLAFEAIPLTATIILYTRLVVIARRQAIQIAALEQAMASASSNVASDARKPPHRLDLKAATTFLYVTFALIIAWIPFHIVELMEAENNHVPIGAVFFTNLLLVSNSWWNVAIYYWRNKAFRKSSRKVFADMFPCVTADQVELITDATFITDRRPSAVA